jgi:hypothetical protein
LFIAAVALTILTILALSNPASAGIKPPVLWGTEKRLRELFGEDVSSLDATRRAYLFRYPSAEHFVGWFREYYGPTVWAFAALDPSGQEALARDLEERSRAGTPRPTRRSSCPQTTSRW